MVRIDFERVLPFDLMVTGTFVIRAARWRVFLAPVLPSSSFKARFATTCIGFMANNLLPARVGEFARAYALSRTEKISASAAFGSLVVERLFDAFVLALFLAVPVLLPARVGEFARPLVLRELRRPDQGAQTGRAGDLRGRPD